LRASFYCDGASSKRRQRVFSTSVNGAAGRLQKGSKKMSGTATNLGDYEAITKVLQHYLDGAKSGKGSEMKPAFHKDATIFGYVGPDLFAGPIQGLYDWNDQNGPATDIKSRVSEIDIVGTIANVRLEIDDWTGSRFTDMFTLLKLDGKWQIMNKVFHLHS
jgi:Putative lumazine-binding